MFPAILSAILPALQSIIDKVIPDKVKAAEINAQIATLLLSQSNAELEQRVKVIIAEAQGQSWLQRNWRPLLMLVIVAIVFNNYVLFPYLVLFGVPATQLELPVDLWDLMKLGVGGYVVGRSAEKIAEQVGPFLGGNKK